MLGNTINPENFGSEEAHAYLTDAVPAGGSLHNVIHETVSDIIHKACHPGGAIFNAIAEQDTVIGENGEEILQPTPLQEPIAETIASVNGVIPNPKVQELLGRIEALEAVEANLEQSYPFRQYERTCETQEWIQGWKRLMVDKDWLDNIADHMDEVEVANTMAASAVTMDVTAVATVPICAPLAQ